MSSSSEQTPPEEKWEVPYPKKKSTVSKWISAICLVVALYLLSTDSIALLYERSMISTDTMAIIHASLRPHKKWNP